MLRARHAPQLCTLLRHLPSQNAQQIEMSHEHGVPATTGRRTLQGLLERALLSLVIAIRSRRQSASKCMARCRWSNGLFERHSGHLCRNEAAESRASGAAFMLHPILCSQCRGAGRQKQKKDKKAPGGQSEWFEGTWRTWPEACLDCKLSLGLTTAKVL